MESECVEKVKDQVQEELKASMTYLAMVIKNKNQDFRFSKIYCKAEVREEV